MIDLRGLLISVIHIGTAFDFLFLLFVTNRLPSEYPTPSPAQAEEVFSLKHYHDLERSQMRVKFYFRDAQVRSPFDRWMNGERW